MKKLIYSYRKMKFILTQNELKDKHWSMRVEGVEVIGF